MANASLGGQELDENPRAYSDSQAARRQSAHRMYDGSTVVQDFGVGTGDRVLRVECDYVIAATKTALETKYSGAQPVVWIDPDGSSMNVIVTSMEFQRWRGQALWRVQFTMQVVP